MNRIAMMEDTITNITRGSRAGNRSKRKREDIAQVHHKYHQVRIH
jgi:hypothetical protein